MPDAARTPGSGLVLRPFRALRYGSAVGDDVGTVTSPPYDVIDDEMVERLHACHAYNVVRLILPRRFAQASSYDEVAALLQAWQSGGVLVRDEDPALYVYEYTVDGQTVRGLVGALGLRDRASGTVLPHEDVMTGPVRDRAELLERTNTNLEPILLVYDGDGEASDFVEGVSEHDPVIDTTAPDGSRHAVWWITDPRALARIAEDLAPRRALIADGHHRYAAYQRVQAAGHGGGRDFGLAMLVDQRRHPLQLGPIHRVVTGLGLHELARDLPAEARTEPFGTDGAGARAAAAQSSADGAAFAATDGTAWVLVHAARREGEVDTHALHQRLLPAWHVDDSRVRYVHDAEHALREARALDGVALLVNPPSVSAVVAASERGRSLPRKSTSFGPKPRMGLLMRTLEP